MGEGGWACTRNNTLTLASSHRTCTVASSARAGPRWRTSRPCPSFNWAFLWKGPCFLPPPHSFIHPSSTPTAPPSPPSTHPPTLTHNPNSLDTISNLELASSGVEERHLFAHKIAQDLWAFICSFAQQTQQGGQEAVLLPVNAMDLWLERFDRKYKQDPSFMFKTGN